MKLWINSCGKAVCSVGLLRRHCPCLRLGKQSWPWPLCSWHGHWCERVGAHAWGHEVQSLEEDGLEGLQPVGLSGPARRRAVILELGRLLEPACTIGSSTWPPSGQKPFPLRRQPYKTLAMQALYYYSMGAASLKGNENYERRPRNLCVREHVRAHACVCAFVCVFLSGAWCSLLCGDAAAAAAQQTLQVVGLKQNATVNSHGANVCAAQCSVCAWHVCAWQRRLVLP